MTLLKQLKPLKPLVFLVFAFALLAVAVIYSTKEDMLCGTITGFKMLNSGGNIGAAPVGFVGYLLEVDVGIDNVSIEFTSNIINPKIGQNITIKKEKTLFFKRPTYKVVDSTKCIQSHL